MIMIKYIVKLIKNVVVSICLLYSVNLALNKYGVVLPINLFTVLLTSFLSFYGIIGLFIVNLFMF